MKKLSPFKWFVLQNFPFIEADFDALTNYELMCKVVEYLNATIDKVNELGTEVEYLLNWFDNLDLQEEVNTKLDEMAESGELVELISAYLNTKAILGFDTKASMKSAENLAEGSICRILGVSNYATGDGCYYRIRTLTSSDVIDDDNIVALTNFETLIAEKIPNKTTDDLQDEIDNISEDIQDIESYIETTSSDITIFIGDSYGSSDMPNNWVANYCTNNGLTLGTDAFNYCTGSAGFYDINGGDNTYLHQIQNIDTTIDKNKVKKIIVAGGWNDRVKNASELKINVETFANYVKANFPNAKLYVGMIANYAGVDPTMGGSINYRDWLNNQILPGYKSVVEFGGYYLNGVEEVMHIYSNFSNDMVHPNQNGCIELAKAIKIAQYSYYHLTSYAEVALTPSTITKDTALSSININIIGQIANGSLFLKTTGNSYLSSYKLVNASDDYFILKLGTYTASLPLLRHVNNLSSIPVTIKATFHQGGANEHPIYQGMLYFRPNGDIELAMNNNYNQTKYISSFSILTSAYALPLLSQ